MGKKCIWGMGGAVLLALLAGSGPVLVQEKNPPPSTAPVKPPSRAALLPDLRINKIWFAEFVPNVTDYPLVAIRGNLKKGVKVLIICDLANAGPADFTAAWQVDYFLDNQKFYTNSWSQLGAGKSQRGGCAFTPGAEGIHSVRCAIVVPAAAREFRDNNQKEVFYNVTL